VASYPDFNVSPRRAQTIHFPSPSPKLSNPFNVLLNADCHVYQTIHVDQRIVPKPNKVFVEHVSVNALEWQTGLG
jgi:hypothetical protein